MQLLYNLLLLLASPFLLPFAVFKGLPYGDTLGSLKERMGFLPKGAVETLKDSRVFWVHAVSVGEVRASQPLIRALKQNDPEAKIVLSCMTFTGNQIARDVVDADLVIFFPFDLPSIVKRTLGRINPSVIVIIETEIWPNFIRCARERNIPLVLANGRISRKSFARYLLVRKVVAGLLKSFSVICVQDVVSARRIRKIGAPVDRIHVTGNMKFDLGVEPLDQNSFAAKLGESGLLDKHFVWVAGSTRSGEAEQLIECHRRLQQNGLTSFMILAPRHPSRCSAVAELLKSAGVPFALRSEMGHTSDLSEQCQVLLVDTVGELKDFYAIAEVVFVGGSLVPKGGHNILEPSCLGKPVLFGPHMFNFQEISQLVLNAGGGYMVADARELRQLLEQLQHDSNLRQKMGQAGQQLISRNVGATQLTMTKIKKLTEA